MKRRTRGKQFVLTADPKESSMTLSIRNRGNYVDLSPEPCNWLVRGEIGSSSKL